MNTYTVFHAHGTFRFNCRQGDFMSRRLRTGQVYERGMLDYIASLAIPGVYVDVGAFIGTHTVYFAELCPAATKVMAFEPQPCAYDMLLSNTQANCTGRVPLHLRKEAAGAAKGVCGIQAGPADNLGMSRVIADDANNSFKDGITAAFITTLDAALAGENVGLIKIDVEGYEMEVLKGARDTLCRCHPHLFIETANEPLTTEMLSSYGYKKIKCFNSSPTWHYQARG